MALLPIGNGKTLHDQVETVVNQAIQDEQGVVYGFGSSFADTGGASGIHDIHMNQGNPLNNHGGDNGIWQDGTLCLSAVAEPVDRGIYRFSDADVADRRSGQSGRDQRRPSLAGRLVNFRQY
jgi:hypothetical protein